MTKFIPLTNYLKLSSPAHILYFYEDMNGYMKNMLAYIKAGIERDHHILLIEKTDIYNRLDLEIKKLFSDEEKKCIHYIDNYTFYRCYGDFHIKSIVKHFGEILTPFFEKEINVRTWANVVWNKEEDMSTTLKTYEQVADSSINAMGLMSVCAYAGSELSASLQNSLMRTHEYLMTDEEFVRSSLYEKTRINL